MKIKAESKVRGVKFFHTISEAVTWDKDAHFFNIFSPGPVLDVVRPRVAIVSFSAKHEEALTDISKAKLTDIFAIISFLEESGFDVDNICSFNSESTVAFEDADELNYDAIFIDVGSMYIDNKLLDELQCKKWSFLQKAADNGVRLVALMKDISIPLYDPCLLYPDFISNSCASIKNGELVVISNSSIPQNAMNLVQTMSTNKIIYSDISSANFAFLRKQIGHAGDKKNDICYVGSVRNGERTEALYEFLIKPALSGLSVLWAGETLENVVKEMRLGSEEADIVKESICFKSKADASAFLSSSYNNAIATIIPFQKNVENIITARFYETMMSNAVVFIDDRFAYHSSMGAMFEDQYRVRSGSEFMSAVNRLISGGETLVKTKNRAQESIAYAVGKKNSLKLKEDIFEAVYGDIK